MLDSKLFKQVADVWKEMKKLEKYLDFKDK